LVAPFERVEVGDTNWRSPFDFVLVPDTRPAGSERLAAPDANLR